MCHNVKLHVNFPLCTYFILANKIVLNNRILIWFEKIPNNIGKLFDLHYFTVMCFLVGLRDRAV
jgi:hypothetical protein